MTYPGVANTSRIETLKDVDRASSRSCDCYGWRKLPVLFVIETITLVNQVK